MQVMHKMGWSALLLAKDTLQTSVMWFPGVSWYQVKAFMLPINLPMVQTPGASKTQGTMQFLKSRMKIT